MNKVPLIPTMLPLLILSYTPLSDGSIAPTHLFVNRVGPCVKGQNLPVSISELSITRKHYDFILTGAMNITGNISNGWDVQATMQKCPDIRNLDTCDFYRSFPVVRAGCTDVGAVGFDFYSMFFHYTSPKMACPVREGRYIIENYPFYTEDNYLAVAETKISTSVFGYTFKLEGFHNEEKILCVDSHLRLLYIRNHNWLEISGDVTPPPSAEEPEDDDE